MTDSEDRALPGTSTTAAGDATVEYGGDVRTRVDTADAGVSATREAPSSMRRALQDIGGGLVGALPVLWVLGAVPWRLPTVLVERMFRGFSSCALAAGSLNPAVMVCERAGVPLGMYQLDGGLSYPLGGAFVQLGADALVAWRLAVVALVGAGFVALFWLGRTLTGSIAVAGMVTAMLGLGSTMTARSWSWYWNVVAAALLPILFASLYVLYDRARARRVRHLVPPAAAVLASVILIGIEWSYAGLFATTVALGAVTLLAVQRGWAPLQRVALVGGACVGGAVVFAAQRWRLTAAGVAEQFSGAFGNATRNAVDLVSLVSPHGDTSLLGRGLQLLGGDRMLAGALTEGDQLWAAPYLGVLTITLLVVVYVFRRTRLEPNPHCPPGYLSLLLAVVAGSLVLSLGPDVGVARLALPDASFTWPGAALWTSTPLRWIRYPWTWTFLTHIALLLTFAALTPALLRRRGSWSPLVWLLAVVVMLEFTSPAVLASATDARPGVMTAPDRNLFSSSHPTMAQFETRDLRELRGALRKARGTVTLLPWDNNWVIPYLATMDGTRVRNVGIDRNVRQVQRVAPIGRRELRHPSVDTVRRMLSSGWADAVVLLDYMPKNAGAIVRHEHQHLGPVDLRRKRWVQRASRQLVGMYCIEPYSWFTVVTSCADPPEPTRDSGHT